MAHRPVPSTLLPTLLPALDGADAVRQAARGQWSAPDAAPDATPDEISRLVEGDVCIAIALSLCDAAQECREDKPRAEGMLDALVAVALTFTTDRGARAHALAESMTAPRAEPQTVTNPATLADVASAIAQQCVHWVDVLGNDDRGIANLQWSLVCAAAKTETEIKPLS